MTEVVTKLVVRADGSLAVLDQFEQKMTEAGKATDRSTGSVASFEARMAKARAAMEAGNRISTESVARRSAEQRAFDNLAASVDKSYGLRIRLEREAERASVSAANAVNMGYISQEQALSTLMALEQRHAAQLAQTSAANDNLAASHRNAAAAAATATAAVKVNTAAHQANAAAVAASRMRNQQLMYQMVDMGQALPLLLSGNIYGLQNMGFQIAQIGQMYYGQGGMGAALKDMSSMLGGALSRVALLGAAVGGATLLLHGFTRQVNEANGSNVSMVDTALAMWESLASAVQTTLGPALTWLVDEFNRAVDQITADTAREVNVIIGLWVGSVDAIEAVWGQIPQALGFITYEASRNVVNGIVYMVQSVQAEINDMLSGFDHALVSLGMEPVLPRFDLSKTRESYVLGANPYASAGSAVGAAGDAFSAAMGKDYVGEWMGGIGGRAQEIAAARREADALGGSVKAANDNVKALADDGLAKVGQFGKSVLSTLSDGFKDLFKNLFTGAKSATDIIADLLGKLGDLFLDQAFNMLIGGMFGGGVGVGGGGRGGLFGGAIIPGILHKGGVAGSDGYSHTRQFSPAIWANAPRYHNGTNFAGLRPNEVPAILERGEKVIPANQNVGGGGGPSVILIRLADGLQTEIINQAVGQSVQVTKGMVAPVSDAVSQMAQNQRYG